MEINLLSGALGAEIKGISLKDTSKENWEKINSLMLEHKVVFFRDQDISSDEIQYLPGLLHVCGEPVFRKP